MELSDDDKRRLRDAWRRLDSLEEQVQMWESDDSDTTKHSDMLKRARIQDKEIMRAEEMENIIDFRLSLDHFRGECHFALTASHYENVLLLLRYYLQVATLQKCYITFTPLMTSPTLFNKPMSIQTKYLTRTDCWLERSSEIIYRMLECY